MDTTTHTMWSAEEPRCPHVSWLTRDYMQLDTPCTFTKGWNQPAQVVAANVKYSHDNCQKAPVAAGVAAPVTALSSRQHELETKV